MIRLEYRPTNESAGRKPVVLVGKTITYDTGGLSLKINNGMVGMKRDKDGGCAVLGAMHAIATLVKPDVPVVGLKTIETMARAGATCLAVDAGRCLLLDGEAMTRAADEAGIAVCAD